MKNQKLTLVLSAIFVASLFRLLPHWPNFTPMATIALLGGVYLSNRFFAFLVPLVAMVISDILTVVLINFRYISLEDYFTTPSTYITYFAFAVITMLGFVLKGRDSETSTDITTSGKKNFPVLSAKLASVSVAAAVLFFIISNFGAWTYNGLPKTLNGLITTYDLGIPFFGNFLLGTLVYNFLFFGFFQVLFQRWPQLTKSYIR